MKNKVTQRDRLLHLLKRGWTSPAEAFARGCGMKLSTRCGELKALGVQIEDKWSEDRSHKLYRLSRG